MFILVKQLNNFPPRKELTKTCIINCSFNKRFNILVYCGDVGASCDRVIVGATSQANAGLCSA